MKRIYFVSSIASSAVVALAALCVTGCSRIDAPEIAEASAFARSLSPIVTVDDGEAGQLCFMDSSAPTKSGTRTPDAWVHRGWDWIRRARLSGDPGFYVNVAACSDAALRIAPEHAGARELRALALMNDHRFFDAENEARRILATSPDDAVALGTLSDALLEQGRFDEAVDAAQRAADIKPDSVAYVRASYFRWLTGDVAGAREFLRLALAGRDRRDPEPAAWTFVEAAKLSWHEGDYDGADAILTEALDWVADYAPALVLRGRVALARQRPQEAVAVLERAWRAQPLPETAWLLADAREASGDAAGAEADRARVVEAGRRSDRLTLALFYATRGRNIDEALRLIEEERKTRGGVGIEDAYAWILYRAGRIDDARVASDHAMRLGTRDARMLFHAGAIRMAADAPAGRGLIETALAINPRFDETAAAEAREMLAAKGGA